MLKKLLPWIMAAIVVAGAVAAFLYFAIPVVEVQRPLRGPAVDAVYATGVVEPVTWAKVTPIVRGRVVELCACEGERISRGDVLARLDDEEPRARLKEYEARARFLESDVARYGKLLSDRVISVQAYERLVSQFDEVRASIAAAREHLADYTLRAPMAGRVLRQDGEVGEVVEPGDVLFWVGEPTPLWIEADVDEEDIPRVRVGQHTLVKSDAFAGQVLAGTVSQITPKGDPVAKSFRVRIGLPAETPLMIGMTTEINIIIREEPGALLVPAEAAVDGRVFVVEGGRATERSITPGIKGARWLQIKAGLSEDDAVIVTPPPQLKAGGRVRVRAAPAPAGP
ncbi:MAG: efflux RND transporter periplasmic adaptor subunit [Defluviicoccus sp.]|nr:efflux RND transporter periplasmic adaptor subunit [Defluviicoccus sp.]MDG4610418.1 efflux RND transporter periplasmic adaptor subunit [Defluviicoccus sp.]